METYFINCIPTWERNQVVIESKKVIVKCRFNCHCFKKPKKSEFYICTSHKFITKGDLIDCLIMNNFNPNCDHYFLEGFVIDSDVQITALFGM